MKHSFKLAIWLLLAAVALQTPVITYAKEDTEQKKGGLRKRYLAAKELYEKRKKEHAPKKELDKLEAAMKEARRKWRLAIFGIVAAGAVAAAAAGAAAYVATKPGMGTLPPLHKYAGLKQESNVGQLLSEQNANANETDSDGNTPLHYAASQPLSDNTAGVIALLKQYDANLNAKNNEGYTPLIIALAMQNADAAKKLIELGADVNLAATWGGTPLFYAIENKHKDIFNLLLTNKAKDTEKIFGYSPAEWAVYFGQYEMAEKLGVDETAQSSWRVSDRAEKMRKEMPAKLKARPAIRLVTVK